MILKPEEQGRFKTLMYYVFDNNKKVFKIENNNTVIYAYYDTAYEGDNDLELDEEGYEELNFIVFRKVSDGTLFEYNYHTLPEAVYDGEHRII